MRLLNVLTGVLVGAVLRPFEAWPPMAGLAVVAALVAALLLVLTKVASNQPRIVAARRQVHAGLLELRLFQDDPQVFARSALDLLRAQGRYLRHAIVPMVWASVPIALLLAHLQVHYGYQRLRPGDTAIVTVHVREALSGTAGRRPPIALELPPLVRLETPPIWVPALREIAWRVRALRDGVGELRVTVGGTSVTKQVCVTSRVAACDAVRPAPGFLDEWRYPAEPRLPADLPIDAIVVSYPARAIHVLGFELPWLVVFLVFTAGFMLAARPIFRVAL